MANMHHNMNEQAGMAAGHQRNYHDQMMYQQLLPVVKHILEVLLCNEFEDSTISVTNFVLAWPFDGRDISQFVPPKASELVMKARVMEGLAHWIKDKTQKLDDKVPLLQMYLSEGVSRSKPHLQQVFYQQPHAQAQVIVEYINAVCVELLGREAACLGSAVGGKLAQTLHPEHLCNMLTMPSTLLAHIVRMFKEIQARVSKYVMELYSATEFMTRDDSKDVLGIFFQHYTVETTTGTMDVHDTPEDEIYLESPFRVNLIDSFGNLMELLYHLEELSATGVRGMPAVLAVDFEGVKLCRHGALCLVQMTCNDDPRLVYVLDVHVLGQRAFTMETPQGMSMKRLLEDRAIRKVWFDPRNDVDALYHQFGIMPRGIFDLQLAEVADRRNRGLNVNYVQGLYKCLTQCTVLSQEQKQFAERINTLGKRLFEPLHGGSYEIFQQRPLNAVILVYAAHDSRYMLALYDQYLSSMSEHWMGEVLRMSDSRAEWCYQREYVVPSSEAPDF